MLGMIDDTTIDNLNNNYSVVKPISKVEIELRIDIREFLLELEMILQEHVKNNYPIDWDEDFITRSILKGIRNRLGSVVVKDLKERMRIEWLPYKLMGRPENKFGDIAILVNIRYQDGDQIEGVAFLEAKKRDINKTRFGAIRIGQLKRIIRNAPSSMVLLYDYDDITQFANFKPKSSVRGLFEWLELKPCTSSVVVPTSIVAHKKKKDTTLYKFSLPFSYQIVFRYFQGFDLEFRETPIKIAKGYASEKGLPTYLVVVSITYGRAEPQVVDFNRNRFGEVE